MVVWSASASLFVRALFIGKGTGFPLGSIFGCLCLAAVTWVSTLHGEPGESMERHGRCHLLLGQDGSPSSWEEALLFYKRWGMNNFFLMAALFLFAHGALKRFFVCIASMPWNELSGSQDRVSGASDPDRGVRASEWALSHTGPVASSSKECRLGPSQTFHCSTVR